MLTADEETQLRTAMSAIERRAAETLSQARGAWQAVAFVRTLHGNTDTLTAASDATTAPECKPGCAYCCSALVEVSDPEALYIARHIQQMPAENKLPLLERLRMQAAERREGYGEGENPVLKPCAFLHAGLCSIYSIRPAVCRKAHSLSASACETGAPRIPQNLTRTVQCEALTAGINQAYQHIGLPASHHELAAAVLAALDEGAEEAWYRGTPLLPHPSSVGS